MKDGAGRIGEVTGDSSRAGVRDCLKRWRVSEGSVGCGSLSNHHWPTRECASDMDSQKTSAGPEAPASQRENFQKHVINMGLSNIAERLLL